MARVEGFTARQAEIDALAGLSNAEVGRKLGMSRQAVRIHRMYIAKKKATPALTGAAQVAESNGSPDQLTS